MQGEIEINIGILKKIGKVEYSNVMDLLSFSEFSNVCLNQTLSESPCVYPGGVKLIRGDI